MDQRTEQERINNIHTGWKKYKELNPNASISPEFDTMIESRMMEANGIEKLKEPTKSEKVQFQAEMVAECLKHDPKYIESSAKIMAQENPNPANKYIDKFKVFAARTIVVGGLSLGVVGSFALVKTPMGGVVKDIITYPIKKIVEIDNQRFEEEFEEHKSFVEEMTGKTIPEIMNNDEEEKTNGHSY